MSINKISDETLGKIKSKSVINIPDTPNMTAKQLKQIFINASLGSANSLYTEINRIIDEINGCIEVLKGELNTDIEKVNEDIELIKKSTSLEEYKEIKEELTQIANALSELSLDVVNVIKYTANLEERKVNTNDIVDNITSTDINKPLSANQGRVLKGLITQINSVLESDDEALDTVKEIVSYIKENKATINDILTNYVKIADFDSMVQTATCEGVLNRNNNTQLLKFWLGLMANYNAIENKEDDLDTVYFVRDEEEAVGNQSLKDIFTYEDGIQTSKVKHALCVEPELIASNVTSISITSYGLYVCNIKSADGLSIISEIFSLPGVGYIYEGSYIKYQPNTLSLNDSLIENGYQFLSIYKVASY